MPLPSPFVPDAAIQRNFADLDSRFPIATGSIQDGAITVGKLEAPEAWHEIGAAGEPAFGVGWSNFGGALATAAFYKDLLGIVHLKGTVNAPAAVSNGFTLPVGYRPEAERRYSDPSGQVAVTAAGVVSVVSGAAGARLLDAISFRAA